MKLQPNFDWSFEPYNWGGGEWWQAECIVVLTQHEHCNNPSLSLSHQSSVGGTKYGLNSTNMTRVHLRNFTRSPGYTTHCLSNTPKYNTEYITTRIMSFESALHDINPIYIFFVS